MKQSEIPNTERLLHLRSRLLPAVLILLTFATALLAVGIFLQFGVWTNEEVIHGPFPTEQLGSRIALVPVGSAYSRIPCCIGVQSDSIEHDAASNLRAWLNGRELGPPHTLHDDIRSGKTAGFSHWGKEIRFFIPESIPNDQSVTLRARYPIQYSTDFLTLSAAVELLLLPVAFIGRFGFVATIEAVVRMPYLLLRIAGYLALTASLIYIASSIVALITGWALPTTALIRWSRVAVWLARHEMLFGFTLLACAAFGTIGMWSALLIPEGKLIIKREEIAFLRCFGVWVFVIVTCAFVFSLSTMWAGIFTPGQFHRNSIGGLIPFFDATGYTGDAYDQAKNGIWSSFSLRRPLAAAFRTVLLFCSGYSYSSMLLLQTCLLSAASCFATWAIVRWRGLWAGVAFLGLTYTYVRIFAPTALTEPLGLCWALFAIPFLIECLRSWSLANALLALAATTMALMTRMAAMFTIPALILWIVWQFGRNWRQRLAAGTAGALVVVGVLSANFMLTKSYGTGQDVTGINFADTLCGLTMGTTWDGCPKRIQEQGKQMPAGDVAHARFLYAMAWENFKNHPDVLMNRMMIASQAFIYNLPDELFRGAGPEIQSVPRGAKKLILLISIVGLTLLFFRERAKVELLFWMLLWLSIVASAAIIYFDDGDRVLSTSYVLLWLFFALGFANPTDAPELVSETHQRRLSLIGISCFAAMALLFFGIPLLAYRMSSARQQVVPSVNANEAVVFGGRRMSGLLVVPDGAVLRNDVPTVHLSTFSEIIRQSGVERYQGLLSPQTPELPFGFIYAPRLDPTGSYYEFIVPPEVIERQDVSAWQFDFADWDRNSPYGPYWFYVTHAAPLR